DRPSEGAERIGAAMRKGRRRVRRRPADPGTIVEDDQLRSARGARAIVVRSLRRSEPGAFRRELTSSRSALGAIPCDAWRLESCASGFTWVGLPVAEPIVPLCAVVDGVRSC